MPSPLHESETSSRAGQRRHGERPGILGLLLCATEVSDAKAGVALIKGPQCRQHETRGSIPTQQSLK